jgi:hypothetical protein
VALIHGVQWQGEWTQRATVENFDVLSEWSISCWVRRMTGSGQNSYLAIQLGEPAADFNTIRTGYVVTHGGSWNPILTAYDAGVDVGTSYGPLSFQPVPHQPADSNSPLSPWEFIAFSYSPGAILYRARGYLSADERVVLSLWDPASGVDGLFRWWHQQAVLGFSCGTPSGDTMFAAWMGYTPVATADLRLWSRVLTAAEVWTVANGGRTGDERVQAHLGARVADNLVNHATNDVSARLTSQSGYAMPHAYPDPPHLPTVRRARWRRRVWPAALTPTQRLVPDGDVSLGRWAPSSGATLAAALAAPGGATAQTWKNPNGAEATVTLSDPVGTPAAGDVTLTVTHRHERG